MHVDFGAVAVNVFVDGTRVLVPMRMEDAAMAVVWRISVRDALRNACQIENTEQDQHQADSQFHGETDARRDDDIEENNDSADTEDGDGVADPPKNANNPCLPDAALAADNRRDSDDVIGIRGVAHAEDKSKPDGCHKIHHAALSQFHRLNRHLWLGIASAAQDNLIILMSR